MAWYQEWFGEEYLELYAHRDEAEARQQVEFFQRQFGAVRGAVLDLACGMGRHMAILKDAGYRPVGCDLSFVLLLTGTEEYGPMPVARADMRQLPFCTGSLGGLVNFFTSFGYFATDDENLLVVQEMARVLGDGAVFLFDYLNVERELDRMVHKEVLGAAQIERWFDLHDRSFNKRITIGEKRYLERVRGYDLGEISAMFQSSGLAIESVFGDFNGAAYEASSPRLILTGRRSAC